MNIFVANLNYKLQDNDLKGLFESFGTVDTARVVFDRETRRSKGFGFVEMPVEEEANAAIRDLDGKEVMGKNIAVKKAFERNSERPQRPSHKDGNAE
jgi:RNA recognition motif-containing protein